MKTFKNHSVVAKRDLNYFSCNGLDTLIWLANPAALEIQLTPSSKDYHDKPDRVVRLDPEPPASYDDVVSAALLLKERLESLSLRSYVKTSGRTGLHTVISITYEYNFRQTREFVHLPGKTSALI